MTDFLICWLTGFAIIAAYFGFMFLLSFKIIPFVSRFLRHASLRHQIVNKLLIWGKIGFFCFVMFVVVILLPLAMGSTIGKTFHWCNPVL